MAVYHCGVGWSSLCGFQPLSEGVLVEDDELLCSVSDPALPADGDKEVGRTRRHLRSGRLLRDERTPSDLWSETAVLDTTGPNLLRAIRGWARTSVSARQN